MNNLADLADLAHLAHLAHQMGYLMQDSQGYRNNLDKRLLQ